MKFSIKKSAITILSLTLTGLSFAQSNDENTFNSYFENPVHNSNIIPSTPNASNFTIYGDTPVNASSGLPSINIPLFTFDVDGVQVPISLSYHASGIKVDDLASAVGLKWTLNTGGGVFRTVKDVDDFGEDINGSQGWIRNTPTNRLEEWISNNSNYNFESQYAQNSFRETVLDNHDEWPDEFNYNFLGYSGEFIFKTNGEIYKAQKDRVSIQGWSSGFIAEDQAGNIFYFNEKETNSKLTTHFTESTTTFNVNRTNETTGWLLSEITTKNGNSIAFDYDSFQFENELIKPSQQLVSAPGCEASGCNLPFGCIEDPNSIYIDHVLKSTNSFITSNNKLIKKIFTDDVEVEFNYTSGSLNGDNISGWDIRLTEIIITDKLQNKQKRFLLNYETYSGNQRLKLKEIIEIGFDNEVKPPYVFNYYNGNLPAYNSYSKDLKGFYNGKPNLSLIPKTVFSLNRAYVFGPQSNQKVHPGYEILADRYFDLNYLKRGALEEIIYPTGGKTKFIYEANAQGENIAEHLLVENEINLSNQGYYIYTDPPYEVYGVLVNLKDVAGRFKIESYADCPDCDDDMGNLNIPIIRISEYSGAINQPINQNLIGNAILGNSLQNINTSNLYLGFLNSNYSNNDLNGTYIFQLRIHEDANIAYPNLFVNLGFKWHNKKRDQSDQFVYQKHYYGGLRIKEIKDIDVNDTVYNHKRFTYLDGVMGDEFDSQRYYKGGLSGTTGQDIFSSDFLLEHGTAPSNGYVYTKVKIENTGVNNTGYIYEHYEPNYVFNNIKGGDLIKREVYNSNSVLLQVDEFIYERSNPIDSTLVYSFIIPSQFEYSYSDGCREHGGYNWNMPYYHYYSNWKFVSKKYTTQFLSSNSGYQPVTTVNEFDYNDDLLVIYEKTDTRYTRQDDGNGNITYPLTHSQGEYVEVEYTYKSDYPGEQSLSGLPIGLPVSKEVKNKGQKIQGQFFEYDSFGNIKNVFQYNKGQGSNNSPLNYIPTDYEQIATYTFQQGKPVQILQKDGTPTSYIYGYNHQYPVAKIENKAYSAIPSGLISAIHTASTTGTESQLQTALNNLRNDNSMTGAMVTTYTYKPLMGVTSITGPNGDMVEYFYDGFGRLEAIKDRDGNLMQEFEYNYGNN